MILVTGGAGFIGSNFVIDWLASTGEPVLDLDKLTYAGSLASLQPLQGDRRHRFVQGDIGNRELVRHLLAEFRPRAIVNFAAESHVDRSILGPEAFVETNVAATLRLLDEAKRHCEHLTEADRARFRFLHVSTDEVYGTLGPGEPAFTETSTYSPNSPYAASKAASDHLMRAWHHTFGMPTLTTNCSNNYGPRQFPEKPIPLMIHNALSGLDLPVYGDGRQVRDWLYVGDHCSAIRRVLEAGCPGQTYNIGGNAEHFNIDVVHAVCDELARARPGRDYRQQIRHVRDRPGHDRRYAIDASKVRRELGWHPAETFASGLAKTVRWYLDNPDWVQAVTGPDYRHWVNANYGTR